MMQTKKTWLSTIVFAQIRFLCVVYSFLCVVYSFLCVVCTRLSRAKLGTAKDTNLNDTDEEDLAWYKLSLRYFKKMNS